jgi:ubiquinone/menaquinone biosynthesis C-methylase UbiE
MTEKDKPTQQQIWEEISCHWKKFRRKNIPAVEEFLSDKKGKVLDLGCGSGRNLIANKNLKYYCLDFSKGMIKYAKEKAVLEKIKAGFLQFDLENESKLSFDDKFFDAVLFIRTLHCISGEKNRERVLKEVYRVMKPHAKMLLQVWNNSSERFKKHYKEKFKEGIVPWSIEGKKYERYYYLYDKNELISVLEKIGFKIIGLDEAENLSVIAEKL